MSKKHRGATRAYYGRFGYSDPQQLGQHGGTAIQPDPVPESQPAKFDWKQRIGLPSETSQRKRYLAIDPKPVNPLIALAALGIAGYLLYKSI